MPMHVNDIETLHDFAMGIMARAGHRRTKSAGSPSPCSAVSSGGLTPAVSKSGFKIAGAPICYDGLASPGTSTPAHIISRLMRSKFTPAMDGDQYYIAPHFLSPLTASRAADSGTTASRSFGAYAGGPPNFRLTHVNAPEARSMICLRRGRGRGRTNANQGSRQHLRASEVT